MPITAGTATGMWVSVWVMKPRKISTRDPAGGAQQRHVLQHRAGRPGGAGVVGIGARGRYRSG